MMREVKHLFLEARSERRPALFLDRDGVLIEDRHHLHDPDHVSLCAGAQILVQAANQADWPVIVVTNQSGIARGLFDWDAYQRVSDRLCHLLGAKAPLTAIYANGYGPDAPADSWRKPSPTMLLTAAQDLNLDLGSSMLIGDRLSDLQAGARAGLNAVLHVLSGHGRAERESVLQSCDSDGRLIDHCHGVATPTPVHILNTLHDFPLHLFHP